MKSSVIRFLYAVALVTAVVYAFFAMRGPHGGAAYTQKRPENRGMEESKAAPARENQIKRGDIERPRQSQANHGHGAHGFSGWSITARPSTISPAVLP